MSEASPGPRRSHQLRPRADPSAGRGPAVRLPAGARQHAIGSITRVSRNARQWLGVGPSELIGRPIEDVFTHDAIHLIRGQLQTAVFTNTVARAFSVALLTDGSRFDVAVHVVDDSIVIECEPCVDEQGVNSGALVRAMIARLQQTTELRTFYRVAAREMRGLTGFDRVMVYRFDHDGSGEVIAEVGARRARKLSRPALSGLGHPQAGAHPLRAQLAAHHSRHLAPSLPPSSPASSPGGRSTCR